MRWRRAYPAAKRIAKQLDDGQAVAVSPRQPSPSSPASRSASSSSSERASIPLAQIAGSVRSRPTSCASSSGEREQEAVGIGVYVTQCSREMRDIAPPGHVPLGRDGVREQGVLRLEPELA